MQQQIGDLYIPSDERRLRSIQRRGETMDRAVREWAGVVIEVLPRSLPLVDEELKITHLFLAQQHRLNVELDARSPQVTLRTRIGRLLPIPVSGSPDLDVIRAVHRIVSTRLESDIDRACAAYCEGQGVPPVSDPAIDWRVAMRFMAQGLHRIASQIDMRREYATSAKRFDLALFAREASADVIQRRRTLFAAFEKTEAL